MLLFLQLKKMSNKKKTSEAPEDLETVEQASVPGEKEDENKPTEKVKQNGKVVNSSKPGKGLKSDSTENGKAEPRLTARERKKRKYLSKEEISRAR